MGALLLGTAALFVGLLAYVVGVSVAADRSSYYLLFIENVKGLVPGSKVNFQGIPVGSVVDIRFKAARLRSRSRLTRPAPCCKKPPALGSIGRWSPGR